MDSPVSFLARPPVSGFPGARLLLLSYHFPPGQSAGALRWQKLAAHAARRGWMLDVVTLEPGSLTDPDPERLRDLPDGIRLFGVPRRALWVERPERYLHGARRRLQAKRPARPQVSLARSELVLRPFSPRFWIRAYDSWVEDARERTWSAEAARLGHALIQPGVHRAVISCGPPQTVHEAARRLSERVGLPLVMDLRDPWSLVERVPEAHASPLRMRKAATREARAVARAGLVVMNTGRACQAMHRLYPGDADRIIAVMNGVDDDEELPRAAKGDRFLIAYAGSVYLDRDPRRFFRAAARLVREAELRPNALGIEFMGHTGGMALEAIAAEEGLAGFVRLRPRGTRREAAAFLARAAMLLNLPQDSELAIPSKVFEYLRHEAWLLALEKPGSATELVLRETGADVVAPDDIDGITAVLRRRYLAFARGDRPKALIVREGLSRRVQAERLFAAIERITGRPTT